MNKHQQYVYEQLKSKNINPGTEEQFLTRMKKQENLDKVYQTLSNSVNLGSKEQFYGAMGYAPTPMPISDAFKVSNEANTSSRSTTPKPAPLASIQPTPQVPTPMKTDSWVDKAIAPVLRKPEVSTPITEKDKKDLKLPEFDADSYSQDNLLNQTIEFQQEDMKVKPLGIGSQKTYSEIAEKAFRENPKSVVQYNINELRKQNDKESERKSELERTNVQQHIAEHGAVNWNPFKSTPSIPFENKAIQSTTAMILDRAENILNAPKKGSGIDGYFKGYYQTLFDPKTWTMGISEMMNNAQVKKVVDKMDTVPYDQLELEEKRLIDAVAIQTEAELIRADNTSNWYKGGQGVAEMATFIAELAVTGGAGKAILKGGEKALLKVIADRVANSLAKHTLSFGTKAVARLGAAGIGAAISPTVVTNTVGNQIGTILPEHDGYTAKFGGRENVMSLPQAYGEAWFEQAKEYATEMSSGSLGVMFKYVKGIPGMDKAVKWLGNTPIGRFGDKATNNMVGKWFKDNPMLRAVYYSNPLSEYNEEFDSAFIDHILGREDIKESFLNWDAQAVLTLTLAPMSLLGIGGNAYSGIKSVSNYQKSDAKFTNILKEQGYSDADIQDIKISLNSVTPQNAGLQLQQIIGNIGENGKIELDENLYKEGIKYIFDSARYNAYTGKLKNDITTAIEQSNAHIAEITNKDTGTIQQVALFDGQKVHVLGGNLAFTEKGHVDNTASDKVIYYLASDGTVQMASPNKFNSLISEQNAEEISKAEADKIERVRIGQANFPVGVSVTVLNKDTREPVLSENGQPQIAIIEAVDENGVTFNANGLQVTLPFEAAEQVLGHTEQVLEEKEATASDYVGKKIEKDGVHVEVLALNDDGTYNVQFSTGENQYSTNMDINDVENIFGEIEPNIQDSKSDVINVETDSVPINQEIEAERQAFFDSLPRVKSGNRAGRVDSKKLTPEQAFRYTKETQGIETAIQDIKEDLNGLFTAIRELKNKLQKTKGNAKIDIREDIRELEQQEAELKTILDREAPGLEAAERAKAEEKAKIEAEIKAENKRLAEERKNRVLTDEERKNMHNYLVNLIKQYNEIPPRYTNKRAGIYQEITKRANALGYKMNVLVGGKFYVEDEKGNQIRTIAERTPQEEIDAHKVLEEYSQDFQDFTNFVLSAMPEHLDFPNVNVPKAVADIQAGVRTVASNRMLDQLEVMYESGEITIRATQFTPEVVLPIEEYKALFDQPEQQTETLEQIPEDVFIQIAQDRPITDEVVNFINELFQIENYESEQETRIDSRTEIEIDNQRQEKDVDRTSEAGVIEETRAGSEEVAKEIIPEKQVEAEEKTKLDQLQAEANQALEDFLDAFNDLNSDNLGIIDQTAEKQAKMLVAGTKMIGAYTKLGVYKFADIVKQIADRGIQITEELLSALKAAYGAFVANNDTDGLDEIRTVRKFQLSDLQGESNVEKNQTETPKSENKSLSLFDNLNQNQDGRNEQNTRTDNSRAKSDTGTLSALEPVGAGTPIPSADRISQSERGRHSERSEQSGTRSRYDVNKNYTNEEIHEIVSSVTEVKDGKIVITGEVTEDIKTIANRYKSGGVAKKGRGILDEYYTDSKIVEAVGNILSKYFPQNKSIRVLEPSVGTGNFIQAIPTSKPDVVTFEINETTAKIAKIFNPNIEVNLRSFETEFIDDKGKKKPFPKKFNLVLGNPPYGEHRGFYKGLGEESKIAKYEDYFVKRGLDVLEDGGILAMVLPSGWMNRHRVEAGYTIEAAYRLPSGAFEATEIGTDIVVLRKKIGHISDTPHDYFENHPENVLGEVKERKNRFGRMEQYVDGDLNTALEAIKANEANKVADELQIEKTPDNLFSVLESIDETGTAEKAKEVVKTTQEQEKKASKKTTSKPSDKVIIEKGKLKYQLSKGDEIVPASLQFPNEFTPDDVAAFKDCDYSGVFQNPDKHKAHANYVYGKWVHDFYYAEGNIYAKLEQLELDKINITPEQYKKQKEMLQNVLPAKKTIDQISISPNTEFVKNLTINSNRVSDGKSNLQDLFVDFLRDLPSEAFGNSSRWEVQDFIFNRQVYGQDKNRNQLIRERRKEAALDLFNKFLTEELTDNERSQVEFAFNREYNAVYRPDYSKVPMFSEINKNFKNKNLKLTEVQRAGVGRMTVKGVGVLAHEVGFGKTLSGILSMHEAMTRGFATKPLIVVPNDSILKQWVETILEVVPNSTVNVLGNLGVNYDLTDFKVNDGEYTIVTYQGFKAMRFHDSTYESLSSEFHYITDDLSKHKSQRDLEIERAKQQQTKGRMMRGAKYNFEDFGFDFFTFDEVHNANHIVGKVKLDRSVSSDFRTQSQRTSDLGIKTWLASQYIQQQNNSRNVVLLSATPFTNKPLEYYSILSLVANSTLKRMGFYQVDQFFETFMEADNDLEIKADGSPAQKTNVRRFKNNGLFQQLLGEFIDIKGEEDNPELIRPERHNKEYKITQNDLTRATMDNVQGLLTDNETVLSGITQARQAAFSPYASYLYPETPKNYKEFVENSPKINATIKLIEQNKRDNTDAGQLIYSELGVEFFPMIREYLIKESKFEQAQVAIITGATSVNERVRIQNAFNKGDIKVVIGSPAIKEGVNLQENTTDLYILSLPYNFTQLRQVEGRSWRQGNKWANIRVNYMLTNDTVDVFMLQRLQIKQGLYNEAMKNGADTVDVSDIDTSELKTALITDPTTRAEIEVLLERSRLETEKTKVTADLAFVLRKYERFNDLRNRLSDVQKSLNQRKEWAKTDTFWKHQIERDKLKVVSLEKEISDEKQELAEKGVNVDDIENQEAKAIAQIESIDEKIKGLEQHKKDLVEKYFEESLQKSKTDEFQLDKYLKKRTEENNSGFYRKQDRKPEFQILLENQPQPASKSDVEKVVDRLVETGLAKDVIIDQVQFDKRLDEELNKKQFQVRTDRSGNPIGDGSWHVEPDVINLEEYPQVSYNISLSDTTESSYVTYTNNDNGKKITVRFSNHDNNATKFGDQLNGFTTTANEILFGLGLMQRKFVPNTYLSVPARKVKNTEVSNYEETDLTIQEIYALGKGADISKHKGKLAKGSKWLILGDTISEQVEKIRNFLGQEVAKGKFEYSKIQLMQYPNGTVYGFVDESGVVYLNPKTLNINTPIHEFGHLWVNHIKRNSLELYEKGKELFKNSQYLKDVQADKNYSHLEYDGQIGEAMARAIGDNGEAEVNKTTLQKIKDWIADVWKRIGSAFGHWNLTSEQISKLSMKDFTDLAISELLSGENLIGRDVLTKPLEVFDTEYIAKEVEVEQPVDIAKEISDRGVEKTQNANSRNTFDVKNPILNQNNFAYSLYKASGAILSPINKSKHLLRYTPKADSAPSFDLDNLKKFNELFEYHIGVYQDFLQRAKHLSTPTVQNTINEILDEIDYAKWYYNELAKGRDVWRTESSPAYQIIRGLKLDQAGFYSTVEDALGKISQEKGTRDQFKAMLLKNGAKQAELDWMGYDGTFTGKSVTKTEIQGWIDQNRIEVEEVEKGAASKVEVKSIEPVSEEYATVFTVTFSDNSTVEVDLSGKYDNDPSDISEREIAEEAQKLRAENDLTYQGDEEINPTKYSQYVLPGGENYKELLLAMPDLQKQNRLDYNGRFIELQKEVLQRLGDKAKYPAAFNLYDAKHDGLLTQEELSRLNSIDQQANKKLPENFKSSHFNEPNILAHVRFNEREVNGERVLFIEEIQSDWAQQGKKEGFRTDKLPDNVKIKEVGGNWQVIVDGRLKGEYKTEQRAKETAMADFGGVPDMPFKKTDQWVNLALRRMMMYAAENGYDRIAWTTGQQQADRYDLSKQVDDIYTSEYGEEWTNRGYEKRKDVEITLKGGEVKKLVVDDSGKIVSGDYVGERLENVIGKEITEKILSANTDTNFGQQDLKVGGEGMKAFYDRIVPKAAGKLGKPFGANVETINIPEIGKQLSIPVTRPMHDSVTKGVPLFHIVQTATTPPNRSDYNNVWDFMEAVRLHQEANIEVVPELAKELDDSLNSLSTEFIRKIQDSDISIKLLQNFVADKGGVVNDNTDAYNDKNRSIGRVTFNVEEYENKEMQGVIDAYEHIIKNKKLDAVPEVPTSENITPDMRKIGAYLQAKDIVEGIELGLVNRGYEGFLNTVGVSAEEYIQTFETAVGNQAVKQLIDAVKEATQYGLDYEHAAGLMSTEEYEKHSAREHYVPQRGWFERDVGKETHYIKTGSMYESAFNPVAKRAKGRESLASDPLAYIQSIAHGAIVASEKNRYKQKALNLVRTNIQLGRESGAFDFKQVWYVNTGQLDADGNAIFEEVFERPDKSLFEQDEQTKQDIEAAKKAYALALSLNADTTAIEQRITDLYNSLNIRIKMNEGYKTMRTSAEAKQHEVEVYENGQKYIITFADERIANAVNNNQEFTVTPYVQNKLGRVTRYMSAIATQYNPAFAVWNFARDFQLANMSVLGEEGFGFMAKLNKNVFFNPELHGSIARHLTGKQDFNKKHDKLLREFFASGAATGYTFLKDLDQIKKDLNKIIDPTTSRLVANRASSVVNTMATVLSGLTEYSELLTRFATFVTAVESGKSYEQASTMAKNVSVNFNRKGTASNMFSTVYAFFNANIQGVEKAVGLMKNQWKVMIPMAAGMIVIGFVNTLMNPDDPDTERNWSEYDRNQNLLIFGVKVPLAHFFRAFHAMGAQLALAYRGDKTLNNALFTLSKNWVEELLPVNALDGFEWDDESNNVKFNVAAQARSITPTGLAPMADVAMNRTFYGSRIHPEAFVNKDKVPQMFLGKRDVNPTVQKLSELLFMLGGGDVNIKDLYKADGTKVSSWLDLNPSDIEYTFKSYTGGVGKTVMDTYNGISKIVEGDVVEGIKSMPVINRAVKPYNEEKVFFGKLYELKHKINVWENSVREREKSFINDGTVYNPAVNDYIDLMTSEKGVIATRAKALEKRIETYSDINKSTKDKGVSDYMKSEMLKTRNEIDELLEQWNNAK